ncbi:hypothetical protein BJX63DRAFT_376847 [Aspergillus granulosus]|uniref:Uncharacterized protein n=1 Tax=Aspergillus granulosus TaxID=176169 RepID=A0ABR4I464_9EURO
MCGSWASTGSNFSAYHASGRRREDDPTSTREGGRIDEATARKQRYQARPEG